MPNPLVSVILPTYNRASLLPKAIQSVLEQDYANLELIIVDDGSTDDTADISLATIDRRMRFIRFERNRGVASARNVALEGARGEFAAFADSDDVWLPRKLSAQVQLLERHQEIDLVFGDYFNINHITRNRDFGFNQTSTGLCLLQTKLLDTDSWDILSGLPEGLLQDNFVATPTVVLRHSVFGKAGRFNTTLVGASDLEFWWRAAVRGVHFAYVSRPLVERNKRHDSLTAEELCFAPRLLECLELCSKTARELDRSDLLSHVNSAEHRVWRAVILEHARRGNRHLAWEAFRRSLSFGNSGRAWVYIALSLLGADGIQRLKQARSVLARARLG